MTCNGFDMDVLGPIVDSRIPFILVNDSPEIGSGKIQRNYAGYQNMSLINPPKDKKFFGDFNTKIWLIRFQSFIRVVICTGNQHPEDWLIWLNAYWYQDFSIKTENKQKEIQSFNYQQDFKQTLNMVLKNMFPENFDLNKQLGIQIQKYDFSEVKVILIPSIPMYFTFMQDKQDMHFDAMNIIYPQKNYMNGNKQVNLFLKGREIKFFEHNKVSNFFYHFEPSDKNCVNGAIPHLKTVIVQNMKPQTQQQKNQCIFFMGSQNLTQASWGHSSYESQIICNNSELGVLFLKMNKEELLNFLPYKYPPRKYNKYDKPYYKQ